MNYYISDTHLGHKNIMKLDEQDGGRHFENIEEHDNLIVENWNKTVTSSDKVYILGDFSWMNARDTEEILRKLNGVKFLIKGNHDGWSENSNCRGYFQGIYDYKMIKDNGRKVVLSHYPILFYQNQHKGAIHLYGHVHNTKEEELFQIAITNVSSDIGIPVNSYNVGCMLKHMDYTPRTLDQILKQKEDIIIRK